MHNELSLFGDDEIPAEPVDPARVAPISDRQVALLRAALDGRGLATMAERQEAIGFAAGRPVDSLRALTQEEALRILSRFNQQEPLASPGNSTWANREKDTWIDKL